MTMKDLEHMFLSSETIFTDFMAIEQLLLHTKVTSIKVQISLGKLRNIHHWMRHHQWSCLSWYISQITLKIILFYHIMQYSLDQRIQDSI